MKFKALVKSFERISSPQCLPNNSFTGFLCRCAMHLDHHLGGELRFQFYTRIHWPWALGIRSRGSGRSWSDA